MLTLTSVLKSCQPKNVLHTSLHSDTPYRLYDDCPRVQKHSCWHSGLSSDEFFKNNSWAYPPIFNLFHLFVSKRATAPNPRPRRGSTTQSSGLWPKTFHSREKCNSDDSTAVIGRSRCSTSHATPLSSYQDCHLLFSVIWIMPRIQGFGYPGRLSWRRRCVHSSACIHTWL